jgi:hypothetical protein
MGLPKTRWEYLKNLGPRPVYVGRDRYKWRKSSVAHGRPKETYRGFRREQMKRNEKEARKFIRKERWASVMKGIA